jgi:hypothetical protein
VTSDLADANFQDVYSIDLRSGQRTRFTIETFGDAEFIRVSFADPAARSNPNRVAWDDKAYKVLPGRGKFSVDLSPTVDGTYSVQILGHGKYTMTVSAL